MSGEESGGAQNAQCKFLQGSDRQVQDRQILAPDDEIQQSPAGGIGQLVPPHQ